MMKKLPSNDTRRYHWTALKPRDLAGQESVWNANEQYDDVDLSSLKSLFANKAPLVAASKKKEEDTRPGLVTLIDPKRANNIAITLARFKMGSELGSAVLQCDTARLDLDAYCSLMVCLPDEDDVRVVKAFSGPRERLGRAEQFFLSVADVPRIRQRVQVMVLILQFPAQLKDLETEVACLERASQQVLQAQLFPRLLMLVLNIGNFLNQGSAMGQASGFKLPSLLQLGDTRSTADPSVTLLDYLVGVVRDTVPELTAFKAELSESDAAKRLSLDLVAAQVESLRRSCAVLAEELALWKPCSELDCFGPTVTAALEGMTRQTEAAAARAEATRLSYGRALAYYGEAAQTPTEDFFGIFATFSKNFAASEAKVAARAKKEQRSMKGK
jgi:hypothetical protein